MTVDVAASSHRKVFLFASAGFDISSAICSARGDVTMVDFWEYEQKLKLKQQTITFLNFQFAQKLIGKVWSGRRY